ncbi:MAG: hypothetical protein K2F57_04720, partial [Candidatus Gastranaerophilales bacterium]|nr:hypothetical protein [Candidatus Gastranaerophilales bacterium]
MSVYLKLLPELYTGFKTGSRSFIRRPGSILSSIKADSLRYKTAAQLQDEIKAAYREYSQSPYINNYLREGIALTPNAKQQ